MSIRHYLGRGIVVGMLVVSIFLKAVGPAPVIAGIPVQSVIGMEAVAALLLTSRWFRAGALLVVAIALGGALLALFGGPEPCGCLGRGLHLTRPERLVVAATSGILGVLIVGPYRSPNRAAAPTARPS